MKARNTFTSIILFNLATELVAVHMLWYNFPPLAYEDDNGELGGILAKLGTDIAGLCFDGNPIYASYNSTMAFEERLTKGDTFVAGPVSRGANTCTQWPSDLSFIPVLESNGPVVLKSDSRTSNAIAQFLAACWALPLILLVSAGIAGCIMWILDHNSQESDFPKPVLSGVWDGFWWAIVSASTVGYGDKAPRSIVGRIWGVVWILVGINVMSFLFTLMGSALTAELAASTSIRGVQTAVVNGSEEHLAVLLEGADVADSTKGMEIASRVSHATVHGLLLSNISSHHVNCALDIVHKSRINIITALNREINAQKTEIGHAAYSTSTKIMGPYEIVLYILLGVLIGLILIMKFCEIVYHRVVHKEILENNENLASQATNLERYAPRLSQDKTANETISKIEIL